MFLRGSFEGPGWPVRSHAGGRISKADTSGATASRRCLRIRSGRAHGHQGLPTPLCDVATPAKLRTPPRGTPASLRKEVPFAQTALLTTGRNASWCDQAAEGSSTRQPTMAESRSKDDTALLASSSAVPLSARPGGLPRPSAFWSGTAPASRQGSPAALRRPGSAGHLDAPQGTSRGHDCQSGEDADHDEGACVGHRVPQAMSAQRRCKTNTTLGKEGTST